MIIFQKLVQEIQGIIGDKLLVVGSDKLMPALLRESSENIIILGVKLDVVLVQVVEKLIGSKDFGNLDELIGVGSSVEKRFFPEDHGREHRTE